MALANLPSCCVARERINHKPFFNLHVLLDMQRSSTARTVYGPAYSSRYGYKPQATAAGSSIQLPYGMLHVSHKLSLQAFKNSARLLTCSGLSCPPDVAITTDRASSGQFAIRFSPGSSITVCPSRSTTFQFDEAFRTGNLKESDAAGKTNNLASSFRLLLSGQ